MKFFGRVARLIVDDKIVGADISFEIEKTLDSTANKATIRAFNLSPTTRSYIEEKERKATVEAGYKDLSGVIFARGNITRVSTERNGPDLVTILECADGHKALGLATVDISLEGATDAQVLERAIGALEKQDLGRGFVTRVIARKYDQGYCYSGPASQLLDEICRKRGLTWSIQDGLIQVIEKGKSTPGIKVILSEESGLVGFPTKSKDVLTAKSLLNPKLAPGRQIQLKSRQLKLSGTYVVTRVKHSGDLREGEFISEIEGKTNVDPGPSQALAGFLNSLPPPG